MLSVCKTGRTHAGETFSEVSVCYSYYSSFEFENEIHSFFQEKKVYEILETPAYNILTIYLIKYVMDEQNIISLLQFIYTLRVRETKTYKIFSRKDVPELDIRAQSYTFTRVCFTSRTTIIIIIRFNKMPTQFVCTYIILLYVYSAYKYNILIVIL